MSEELKLPHEDDFVDIGHGHSVQFVSSEDGEPWGVWVRHACTGKPWHNENGAFIPLRGPTAWHLVSREPLTIQPSIHFMDCGDHGFITAGRWIPA